MEGLIGIAIVWGIIWLLIKSFDPAAQPVTPSKKPFECTMVQTRKTVSGEDLLLYEVAVGGGLTLPSDDHPCRFFVFLKDITEDEEKPILCALEQLQQSDSEIFQFKTDISRLPYANSLITEPLPLCSIPADFLIFPKKGRRKLECIVVLASVATSQPTVIAKTSVSYFVNREDPGYEDLREVEKLYEEAAIRLAMHIAAVDGHLGYDEGEVVKDWLKRRLGALEPGEELYEKEKERLNRYVGQAFSDAKAGMVDADKECRKLKQDSPIAERYDVLSLLLHVARADGVAEKSELTVLREIASKLDVNLEKFRELQDKILPIGIHGEGGSDEELIGISQDMSNNEIRRKLNQEYRKWNGRTTHSDSKIRDQAKEMLTKIAQLRRKYVD